MIEAVVVLALMAVKVAVTVLVKGPILQSGVASSTQASGGSLTVKATLAVRGEFNALVPVTVISAEGFDPAVK